MYKNSGVNLEEARLLNTDATAFAAGAHGIIAACDGIGSKIIPLYERGLYNTIAIDLIAANLNDLATTNSKALILVDYISVHKLDSRAISQIITELSAGLAKYDCVLAGGETSELPHILKEGTIDICGFAVGKEAGTAGKVCTGDAVIALKSSGIHANGFTLIRDLYAKGHLSASEFDNCLEPAYVYYNVLRSLWDKGLMKSGANITGGGIEENIRRVAPVRLDFDKIPPRPIYQKLYALMGDEMYEVFNCGVGFCVFASPENVSEILEIASEFEPFVFGEVL